jgi:hypothetical protein
MTNEGCQAAEAIFLANLEALKVRGVAWLTSF